MNGYIINFATYTFAMIGFIVIVLYVYKKSVCMPNNLNNQYLKVENMIKLSPAKSVYIIKAGYERFLVAGDSSSTTLLAKLEAENIDTTEPPKPINIETLKEKFKINRG